MSSHYQQYKRKAKELDNLADFLRAGHRLVNTFNVGRYSLILNKHTNTFIVMDAETGEVISRPERDE